MKTYTGQSLREMYLGFFQERGHKVIPSASLIPENDAVIDPHHLDILTVTDACAFQFFTHLQNSHSRISASDPIRINTPTSNASIIAPSPSNTCTGSHMLLPRHLRVLPGNAVPSAHPAKPSDHRTVSRPSAVSSR